MKRKRMVDVCLHCGEWEEAERRAGGRKVRHEKCGLFMHRYSSDRFWGGVMAMADRRRQSLQGASNDPR